MMKPIRRKKEYHHTGYRFPDEEQPWWRNVRHRFNQWIDRHLFLSFLLSLTAILTVSTVALIYVSELDARNWKVFSDENHCVQVGTIKGQVTTGVGVSATGQVVTTVGYSGDTRLYKCDGDKIYGR